MAAAALPIWRRPAILRVAVWVGHLALPLAGLALLVWQPDADVQWEDNLAHLVIVGAGSALALWLGIRMGRDAEAADDARLRLLALALVAAAGFQLLHALATPAVLVDGRTAGFDAASPIGMIAAALLGAASAVELTPPRQAWIRTNHRRMLVALLGVMAAWFVVSVAGLPPLDQPFTIEQSRGVLWTAAVYSVLLYGGAAWTYFRLHRRRPSVMVLGVLTSLSLLAETMVVLASSRTWAVSWWEWHVLQAIAFGYLAYAARTQYRREGTATGLFRSVGLDETVDRVRRGHREALESLVSSLRAGVEPGGDRARLAAHVAERFELTEAQRDVLGESADLYRELDVLFRSYLSPDVAEAMVADPTRAELGGGEAVVTVLMADLQGFTAFSERTPPADVVALLNEYFGVIVPIVLDEGGTVVQFVGDAIMAVFNAPREQADHALRAVRCGLRLQAAVAEIAAGHPGAPRFRVGINTGPALVGNIGAKQMRNFTAIGDTTNTAARIESLAEVDEVLVSTATLAAAGTCVHATARGSVEVKNRAEPVEIHRVESLDESENG